MNLIKAFSLLLIAANLFFGQTKHWLNFHSESEIISQTFEWQYSWIATKDYLVRLDMLGREIAVLVDREEGSGNYKVQFNASRLPSNSGIQKS